MKDQKKQDVTQKKHLFFEEEKEYSRVNPIKPVLSLKGEICAQFFASDFYLNMDQIKNSMASNFG